MRRSPDECCARHRAIRLALLARGIPLMPLPGGCHDVLDGGEFGAPAEQAGRERWIGDERGGIAEAAWTHVCSNGGPRDTLHYTNHFQDRYAASRPKICDETVSPSQKLMQGHDVHVGQVADVHEVANRAAVRSRIVCDKDFHVTTQTHSGMDGQRHQVRFRIVTFP